MRDDTLGLRRLCPRECAAIQTFPSTWQWSGKRSAQYRLIGNAVPPLLSKALGQTLLSRAMDEQAPSVGDGAFSRDELAPLPEKLRAAIAYTVREERTNGLSRRRAKPKRQSRILLDAPSAESRA